MALSHVCLGCGVDMARVRAARDPHYGLPMVRCPGCGCAAVRRTARRLGWRGLHALRRSLRTLALNGLALVGLWGFSVGLCIGFAGERTDLARATADLIGLFTRSGERDPAAGIILGMLLLGSLGAGAWLACGVRHVPRWAAVIGWAALLQVGAVGLPVADWLVDCVLNERWPITSDSDAEAFARFGRSALAAGLAGAVAIAGIPIGWAGVRVTEALDRVARRRCRARIRRRRRAE